MDDGIRWLLIGAVPILAGAWLLLHYLRPLPNKYSNNSAALPSWGFVEGQVLDVKVNPEWMSESLLVTVTFRYTVEGCTYQTQDSSVLLPAGWLEPQHWKAALNPGSRIQVHYNRRNPRLATLKSGNAGVSASILVALLGLGTVMLIGIMLAARLA